MPDDVSMDSGALIFATLADVYISSGMIDEAISILKDGLLRNPTYTLAKIILGRAYYIKGDLEESIKVLEGVSDEASDSEDLNLYLGHCYKKLNELDTAKKYYAVTLKINPENKEAQRELEILKPEEEVPSPALSQEVPIEVSKPVTKQIPVTPPQEPPQEVPPEIPEVVPREVTPEPKEAVSEIMIGVPKGVSPETTKEVPKEEPPEAPEIAESTAPPEPVKKIMTREGRFILPEVEPMTKPVQTAEGVTPFDSLDDPINKLLNIKTIKGAFIASKDGLLIQNYYKGRADIEEICALIAEIYNDVNASFKDLKGDTLEKCIIEKYNETICVINAGDSLFTVITQREAKPGIIFVYARKIIEEIQEILG